jgi:hypothetical protein
MRLQTWAWALICTLLLAGGSLAYLTPIDDWNLRDNYDIIKVNEINGSTSNFTTYEDAAGSSVTNLAGLSAKSCSTDQYMDGDGSCIDADNSGTCASNEVCEGGHAHDESYFTETESNTNFVSRDTWTDIDSYPAACGAGNCVQTIGDTSTCIDTVANATLWADYAIGGNQIQSADIGDVDDADVEGDTNTYVDIAGDTMTGALVVQDKISCDDWTNVSITASQISDDDAGTDITADLEEEAHCTEHDGNSLSCDGEELDVDDDFLKLAGDTMSNNITLDTNGELVIDSDSKGIYFGEDADVVMYWDGSAFIIEAT